MRPVARLRRRLRRLKPRQRLLLVALAAGLTVLLVAALWPTGDRWPRRMLVTAYCPCRECCGPNARGVTASGRPVSANGGKFAAADPAVPFGTMLVIPGYNGGRPVEVLDRGGAIKGDHLDVFFPTHEEAKRWGRQWVVVSAAEGMP